MTETKPWNGIPENPERDGWHWVPDANSETVIAEWSADARRWRPWPFCRPEDFAEDNIYLGPVLTPDQVAALLSEAAALRINHASLQRAVDAQLATARREALEEAARVCDRVADETRNPPKWRGKEVPYSWTHEWAASAEGCDDCAAAIRALAVEGESDAV